MNFFKNLFKNNYESTIMAKIDRVKRIQDVMVEALEYCAENANNPKAQEMARKALEYDGRV